MIAGARGWLALLCLLAARRADAQDVRLASRLDKPTFAAVNAIIDTARLANLPTAPLVDKALEGAAKGSDGGKIIIAVHHLSIRMSSAKRVLGPRASSDEIRSAATALDAGVSLHDLARVRAASGSRSTTMPLAVLSDLIGRNVPVATASELVVQLARAGLKDPEWTLYQRNVRSDVDHGADPTVAAKTRARGILLRAPGSGTRPSE